MYMILGHYLGVGWMHISASCCFGAEAQNFQAHFAEGREQPTYLSCVMLITVPLKARR